MKIITKNKRIYFDYLISKTWGAGIILKWHEVKSIKTSNINLTDAIAIIDKSEIWLLNMDIPLYKKTSRHLVSDYSPKWRRKLLLHQREIGKIAWELDKPGNVLLALEVFVNKRGLIKIKIGIWKQKRKVEKKQALKNKDQKRQMDREIRNLKI